ncbi:MAG: two-component regulator propeller domain-containing protein [Ginsengibacter sp.]
MKSLLRFSALIFFLIESANSFSQPDSFNLVLARDKNYGDESYWGTITDVKQDPRGYIWLSTAFKGLQRYDGSRLISYTNDPRDSNSLSNNRVPCFHIDSSGVIWVATYGSGINKFDPVKNNFTRFRHNPMDESSLADDTVYTILRDHLGTLWIGTYNGLDRLDERTGKFTHFKNIRGDPSSLSFKRVWYLYEDHGGTLWAGCGSPFLNIGEQPEDGGLNRFDRATGKFTRYLNDAKDSTTISSNKVRAIFEDSKGNFWIGSDGNGLQIMDRKTGKFTHYYYDPAHPEKLSRPPIRGHKAPYYIDNISFIDEDATGSLWIGSIENGINKYDPVTKKVTYFKPNCFRSFSSRDGLTWFSTGEGDLYNINPAKKNIPYHTLHRPANSLYYEENRNVLWIGGRGLMRKDLNTKSEKIWMHDPSNINSLCNDTITGMKADGKGNLWMATLNGLSRFDLGKESFTTSRHNEKNPQGISGNALRSLFIDHNKNIWTCPGNWVIEKMNPETGVFTHYRYNTNPNNLINDYASCFAEDTNGDIWIGTRGVFRLDHTSGEFYHYLQSSIITTITVDAHGIIWAGSNDGLYYYDQQHDRFASFTEPNTRAEIKGIINIVADDNQNLWVSTNEEIIMINRKRDQVKVYGESYGVHKNTFIAADNFKGKNGELFLGDPNGFYAFSPGSLKDNSTGPALNFTSFKIGEQEINIVPGGILKEPLWQTKEIRLKYDQNIFSFEFFAIDYKNPGEIKYLFMLENYDNNWHSTGADNRAYLFKVQPGNYVLRAKAVSPDGTWTEKSISIIITPPWWRTWWAYAIFALAFIGIVWGYIYYRSMNLRREKKILEEQVSHRTEQLKQSLENLKSTQAQLIQSEKMASLGELTAGIAHEIQNPLNFVNNFSEVNKELLAEMKDEMNKGNIEDANAIANDVIDNEEKINHHGKRADAIVKGMLQHSKTSSGKKELTNINALADEYLRLSYHGFRAKDKAFNATIKTDFDDTIGKLNIVPQDIGRLLLNLYNNAFYAVNEKAKQHPSGYEPKIAISTKKLNNAIELTVTDNGDGIPQNIVDKIFQPFFTTKPTGQGTGLGLSLSYDIVKAHGGEIKVETKVGEGSELILQLPV